MILQAIKTPIADYLGRRAMRRFRSRVGWRTAPLYQHYLDRCRAEFTGELPDPRLIGDAIATFQRDGVASFWTPETQRLAGAMMERIRAEERAGLDPWMPDPGEFGNQNYRGDLYARFPEVEALLQGDLGTFLQHVFGCNFKVLHGVLYRSSHVPRPVGSQLWHSDSGPGTCINTMFYLHETDASSGTLEALPWDIALRIFEDEAAELRSRLPGVGPQTTKEERRDAICSYYAERIASEFESSVVHSTGPAGLVVPFLNNTLHRGGYPGPDRQRYAIVFHFYPSDRPTNWELYRRRGIGKTVPYPADPAADF